MRKTTVVFSDAQWNRLCDIARREHRFPKQQIELWVYEKLGREQAESRAVTPTPPGGANAVNAPEGGRAS